MNVRSRLQRADVLASFVLYGLGTGGLFLADILIGQELEGDQLSRWAFLRSVVFIGASLATVGIDQALIRAVVHPHRLVPAAVLQVSLLSLPVFVISILLFDLQLAFVGYVSALALAMCLIFAGLYRSIFEIAQSQIAFQLWKLPFAVLAFVSLRMLGRDEVVWVLPGVLVPWCAAVGVRVWLKSVDGRTLHAYRQLYPIGARFWLSALVASSAVYLHQIVLNVDGESAASSRYFLYATIMLPVPTLAAGFFGNVLNPYLRQEGDKIRKGLGRNFQILSALLVLTTAAGLGIGLGLGHWLGRFDDGVIWWLAVGLTVVAMTRTAYVVPSGILGVYGTRRELVVLAVGSTISIGSILVLYPLLRWFDRSALVSILVAVLVAGLGRLGHAGRLAYNIVRSGRPLEMTLS